MFIVFTGLFVLMFVFHMEKPYVLQPGVSSNIFEISVQAPHPAYGGQQLKRDIVGRGTMWCIEKYEA